MMLIISTCKEKLSELEFVEPIKNVLKNTVVKHYLSVSNKDIAVADKIILAGTAIQDFDYLKHDFGWLKETNKPVLGICAGMQIIAKEFGMVLKDCKTFGVKKTRVVADNVLAKGSFDAYFLHTKNINSLSSEFKTIATSDCGPAMIKHSEKEIYGCLFHPEVMNEEIIKNFAANHGL